MHIHVQGLQQLLYMCAVDRYTCVLLLESDFYPIGQDVLLAGVGMSLDDIRRMASWGGHALLPAVARTTAAVAAAAELARMKALRKVSVPAEVLLSVLLCCSLCS